MMLTPRQLYTYALCSCAFCYLSSAICFLSSTTVESALQIRLFMQNKANFQKSQMNVSCCLTMNYEQRTMNYEIKNKANTNPIQSQYKPNTKPIRTQFKPKQTQFLSAICVAGQRQKNIRMKGIFYLTNIHRTAMYSSYRYFDLEIQN